MSGYVIETKNLTKAYGKQKYIADLNIPVQKGRIYGLLGRNSRKMFRKYTDGTLKNILVVPVSKTAFLVGKLLFFAICTFAFMLVSWLEILVLALLCSFFIQVTELTILSFLFFLMKMLLGGILLCATQTPFLYLAIKTKGFAAPLTATAVKDNMSLYS